MVFAYRNSVCMMVSTTATKLQRARTSQRAVFTQFVSSSSSSESTRFMHNSLWRSVVQNWVRVVLTAERVDNPAVAQPEVNPDIRHTLFPLMQPDDVIAAEPEELLLRLRSQTCHHHAGDEKTLHNQVEHYQPRHGYELALCHA